MKIQWWWWSDIFSSLHGLCVYVCVCGATTKRVWFFLLIELDDSLKFQFTIFTIKSVFIVHFYAQITCESVKLTLITASTTLLRWKFIPKISILHFSSLSNDFMSRHHCKFRWKFFIRSFSDVVLTILVTSQTFLIVC